MSALPTQCIGCREKLELVCRAKCYSLQIRRGEMIEMDASATDSNHGNQQPQPVVEAGSASHNMRPPMRSGALTEIMEEFPRARLVVIYTLAISVSYLLLLFICHWEVLHFRNLILTGRRPLGPLSVQFFLFSFSFLAKVMPNNTLVSPL